MTDTQGYEERSRLLMDAICAHARRTGRRRVLRDEVASSIGIDPPVPEMGSAKREFLKTALVLKNAGYIDAPVNFEWVQLTDRGIDACEFGM